MNDRESNRDTTKAVAEKQVALAGYRLDKRECARRAKEAWRHSTKVVERRGLKPSKSRTG